MACSRNRVSGHATIFRRAAFYESALYKPALYQPYVARFDAAENAIELLRVQAVHAREQAAEDGAVFVQHREVAVLVQARGLDPHLLAQHLSAVDAAAQHPVGGAVSVVGAAVAVFLEGAAEFTDDDDDRVLPLAAHLL